MGTTMKFSLLIVAVAVVAAVNSFDADAVVPEADIVVPQSALLQDEAFEAYKAHVVTAMDALHTRAQLAMQAKAIATAEREEAQWETAKLMAHNDALMNDMGDNFPALMEVDATKANLQKKADKQVKKEDEKATDDAKEGSKSAPPAEHHASGVHPEHHEDDDAEEDYGNCVPPPGSAPTRTTTGTPSSARRSPSRSPRATRARCLCVPSAPCAPARSTRRAIPSVTPSTPSRRPARPR